MRHLLKALFVLACILFFFLFREGRESTALLDFSVLDIKGWWMVIVFFVTFFALAIEYTSPFVTMFFSASTLLITGVLTPAQFLEGFANEIVMAIAMLCIIVRAMEINGLLEAVGKRILTRSKHFALQLLSMCVPVAVGSAFLNNTPIVLSMTPLVRKWALKKGRSPSKYLLPLSYAAVLGGACTLIGTSTNLVVHGLLRRIDPEGGLTFFELASVGIPCCCVGLVYLICISSRFLPNRVDPTVAISTEAKEFTAEFIIGPNCPLASKTIQEGARRHLRGELLIQVERNRTIIDAPSDDFVLFVGDRLVFLGDIHQIAELHAVKDLVSTTDPKFELDVASSHFAEVVISATSLLIGKTLRETHFRNRYGASVVAIYREGWRVLGNIAGVELKAGDTLMLLSGDPLEERSGLKKDFYYIRHHEKLQVFHPVRACVVLFALVGVVIAVSLGISIMTASICAGLGLIATGSISLREAQNSIMWPLLLLIASSFALGQALEGTGVASVFAQFLLRLFGTDPQFLIGGIVLVTIFCTELMTNNAAALIIFPIAQQVAYLAGYTSPESVKTIGVAVALGASCAYAIPTGYQTHMIVFGPGGYKFTDFIKVGIPIDLLLWALITWLVPIYWPMSL